MEIKKFIDVHVPIFTCNLRCGYCYVGQTQQNVKKCEFKYSVDTVSKALSQERLGGICHFNVCGMGETLIPVELVDYIRAILENGHTVMIVTNGTLTQRFVEYMKFLGELKKHLGFKFSFHYLELQRLNQMDVFWQNVKMVRDNGCSFSIEITANDSYEPYIDEIKRICIENVGAMCHVSVPRDEATGGFRLMSKHSLSEFYDIWKTFNSSMFDFKMRHWGEKRTEFCYAGLWSGLLNLGTGEFNSCYRQPEPVGNMFENPDEEFGFYPAGQCEISHCFNGHSFLTWGVIPELDEESYLDIRNRVDNNEDYWINESMSAQFSKKLKDYNDIISSNEKKYYKKKHRKSKIKSLFRRIIKKIKLTG